MPKTYTGVGADRYLTGDYWRGRSNLFYYQYFRYFVRCLAPEAKSLLDVGSGNAPYLEWFDWIPERVSIDLEYPYASGTVRGITGSILDHQFDRRFDLCTCMQVLEHVPEPSAFARRLLELGDLLLVSVPFNWPKRLVRSHVNDPVDLKSVTKWFDRKPNYHLLVHEPFKRRTGSRLFAIYDPSNPDRRFNATIRQQARPE